METRRLLTFALLLIITLSASSCLKIESKDAGDKVNELLEGTWQLDEFKLNGNSVPTIAVPITLQFIPHDVLTKEGKVITTQGGSVQETESYEISADGQTIIMNNEKNDIFVDNSFLKLSQINTDLEEEVLIEMELYKL